MANDGANVFVRRKAPQAPLANDRTTKWNRNDAARIEKRKDTSALDARVAKHEQDHTTWKRDTPRSASGTPLNANLAKLRDESEQTRISRANPAPPRRIDLGVLTAVVREWRQTTPDGIALYELYEEGDFNRTSLQRAVEWLIAHGHEIDMLLPQHAFEKCVIGNHLEHRLRRNRDGHVVRKRGEMLSQLPPTLHERYVWSDEAEANEQAQHDAAVKAAEAETKRALSMSFEQLQAAVRKNYKPESPTTA
jgi:hypothetical protein